MLGQFVISSVKINFEMQNVIQTCKYVLSTMGVSKESISKFLTGNRFHVKSRIQYYVKSLSY